MTSQHDRLAILMDGVDTVTLMGFHLSHKNEQPDLEHVLPIDGAWTADYVDVFTTSDYNMNKNDLTDWAMGVADAMWGTLYYGEGAPYCDDLLRWSEHPVEGIKAWAVRDKNEYDKALLECFVYGYTRQ